VLATDCGLNDKSGYWHLVLRMIEDTDPLDEVLKIHSGRRAVVGEEDTDPLDEVLKIRVGGGAHEQQRKY